MTIDGQAATVLISLKTFSNKGTEALKLAVRAMSEKFSIVQVSSVYKVSRRAESLAGIRDIKKEERLDALAMVVKATTTVSPSAALEALNQIEVRLQKEALKRTISFNLVVYDQRIVMLPGLSLPHPEMHIRPEELVLAAEVWADYLHPVLKQELRVLARDFINEEWGEFYALGTPLLDF